MVMGPTLQNQSMAGILGTREKSTLSSPVPLFLRIPVLVELHGAQKLIVMKASIRSICETPTFSATMPSCVQIYLEGAMTKQNHTAYPVTLAIRLLREKHMRFDLHATLFRRLMEKQMDKNPRIPWNSVCV